MPSEPSNTLPDDYRQALAAGWLPISEVARRTGVNPVTLRAWERRYGLVVPQRTAKGHRLYSAEQLERIRRVLTWLERGVAVGKVRDLLDEPPRTAAETHSPWDDLRQQALSAIARLDEQRLDELFNGALSIYPAQTLCEHLMLPLQRDLQLRWQGQFGSGLERLLYHSWLRSKLGGRLYHYNRQHQGRPLLLVNQSEHPRETGHWLCAWLASSAGCPVQVFDGPLSCAEIALVEQRLNPRALLLYSDQSLSPTQLSRLLAGCICPTLLVGASVDIHAQELAELQRESHPGLHLAQDPLQARATLHALGLLNGGGGE